MMKLVPALLLALTLAPGCGDDHGGELQPPDMTITTEGAPCVTAADCGPGNVVCAYKIADGCSAKGHCAPLASPHCASYTPLCGCDGKEVRAGTCSYQEGYASGPTLGGPYSTCMSDGGI